MGRCGGERVLSRDRDAKSRLNDRLPELRKLSRSGNRVVPSNLKTAAALWFWFDSVGMRDSSAFKHEIQTSLKFFAAGQRQHRVDAGRPGPIREYDREPWGLVRRSRHPHRAFALGCSPCDPMRLRAVVPDVASRTAPPAFPLLPMRRR